MDILQKIPGINSFKENFRIIVNSSTFKILVAVCFSYAACLQYARLLYLTWIVVSHLTLTKGDATVYLAMGRGVLNGLVPYRDLFEIKPLGIFLLNALSIKLSGGALFLRLFQGLIFAGLPIFLGLYVFHKTKNLQIRDRALLMSVSVLFGTAIGIFMADRSGGNQPESFGAFFGIIFLFTILWNEKRKMAYWQMICAGLLLFAAIEMKEPFAASLLAAVLLLAEDLRFIYERFLLPLVVGTIIGFALYAMIGYLIPYLTLYFPVIFDGRLSFIKTLTYTNGVNFNLQDPLWLRGLRFPKLYFELPWPVPVIPLLLLFNPILKLKKYKMVLTLSSIGVILIALSFFREIEWIHDILAVVHFRLLFNNPLFLRESLKFFGFFVLCLLCFVFLFIKKRSLCFYAVETVAAIYFTTLAVQVGVTFFWQHLVFAVPAYLAAFLLFLKTLEFELRNNKFPVFLIFTTGLVFLLIFQNPKMNLYGRYASQLEGIPQTEQNKKMAEQLDAIMDSCNFDRYFFFPGARRWIFAFTRHSPLELFWASSQDYFERLDGAPLFVTDMKSIHNIDNMLEPDTLSYHNIDDPRAQEILANKFTDSPPACAKKYFPIKGLTILFHKPT